MSAHVNASAGYSIVVALLPALLASAASGQQAKPNVAILVYDGVQVIDHTIPYEVFGQFSLNNVYTVAKNAGEIRTFMGMRILPHHTFADAPEPDVLVLPGGDATDAARDPEIAAWIRRTAASADHVLTICSGTFFLVGTGLLDGARVTTWYDRQSELARVAPEVEVVPGQIVVESGKLVTAAGLGVEGSLRVLARLHGEGWAEVVRLNMEHEPVPASHHVPRVELGDRNLPDGIYSAFPWRTARLERFEGDRNAWVMSWSFASGAPPDTLRERLNAALAGDTSWQLVDEERAPDRWRSRWSVDGRTGGLWRGEVQLSRIDGDYRLVARVRRGAEPCESTDPGWSPDSRWIVFASNCEGDNLDLFLMRADGSSLTRLTRTPFNEHTPAFSPDGLRLAYAYDPDGEDSELWIMAADGSGARQLTANDAADWSPAWSPDGRRIAFESRRDGNSDIWIIEVDDGTETRVTAHSGRDLGPAWRPDGDTIAFQSDREGNYGIYAVPADGGEPRRVVDLAEHAAAPAWSPDGDRLVFTYLADGRNSDLWIARPATDAHPLTAGPQTDFSPAWSPDGRTIAFISRGEGGAWDVWTVVENEEPVRLTFGGEPLPR